MKTGSLLFFKINKSTYISCLVFVSVFIMIFTIFVFFVFV